MLKGDRSFQRRWEIVLADNKTSIKKPPFYIRRFFLILVLLGLIGGAAALWIPSGTDWLRQSGLSGEAEQKSISDLRLHFLYITGGIIAILTLLQTNWKNQVDRHKVEADIKKNEQDAEKNERDHIRQVHAERRSRYTKAIEQLANEKAAVRLGGIYTLMGLVDEWLADDTFNPEERQKEGQVIINNLCSYIRSPFTLALKAEMFEGDSEPDNYKGDFSKDQAAFREEQDVRRTIFVEMSKRSSTFTMKKGEVIETVPGIWSDFDFDFSRAPIFYPLIGLRIEKGNFYSAKFYSNADFTGAKFTQTAHFSGATFTQTADFSWAFFTQDADFVEATFTQEANFSGAKFTQEANFSLATFTQEANFSLAKFTQEANLSWATFTQEANFSGAKFTQDANLSGATFTQDANFSGATFTQDADFSAATFTQNADFSEATFSASSPKFVETSEVKFVGISKILERTSRARFATLPKNQRAYSFTVSEGSFPILLGEAELDGTKYHIPVGTVLFDPSSGETSEPAKPLDKSNDGEEEKPAG